MTKKIESILAGIAAIIVLFSSMLGAKLAVMIASLTLIAFSAYLYFKDKAQFANQLEKIIITTLISVLIAGGIIANIRYFAGEDDWMCEEGQWIKHGNPSAPMPTESCPGGSEELGRISWTEAVAKINNCEVKSVFQAHDLTVVLELKNNLKLKTIEPRIDDIMDIVQAQEDRCGRMIMATE